ncbi:MAG: hypothetical protein ACYC96_02175 [Fimbriimonadaceae bacterium]
MNGTSVPFNADNQLSAPGNWFDGAGNPGSYSGNYFTSDPESRITAIGSANTDTYRADAPPCSLRLGYGQIRHNLSYFPPQAGGTRASKTAAPFRPPQTAGCIPAVTPVAWRSTVGAPARDACVHVR